MTYKVQGTEVITANATISAAGFTSSNADSYIEILSPAAAAYSFQGSNYGYTSGGNSPPSTNVIDKFPFSSDTNATDVGDLTQARQATSGQSSTVGGYTSIGLVSAPPIVNSNVIDRFPFSSDTNATDVGDATATKRTSVGQSSSVSGYISGGYTDPGTINVIEKFLFASNSNTTDVGNLSQARLNSAGQSSSTSGYTSGGEGVNTIDKFPFATDTNAIDVGDLSQNRRLGGGQSSTTSGYTSGGDTAPTPAFVNTIDKFPFASDTNATDVGDLSQSRLGAAGQSSTSSGYTSGGSAPPITNTIDKFPFASDTNATDVGDLSQARSQAAGQQN